MVFWTSFITAAQYMKVFGMSICTRPHLYSSTRLVTENENIPHMTPEAEPKLQFARVSQAEEC
jgi:hypothetical protein